MDNVGLSVLWVQIKNERVVRGSDIRVASSSAPSRRRQARDVVTPWCGVLRRLLGGADAGSIVTLECAG